MTSFKFASLLLATALPITAVCAEEHMAGTEFPDREQSTNLNLGSETITQSLSQLSCQSDGTKVTTIKKIMSAPAAGGGVKLLVVRVKTLTSTKFYKVKRALREGGRIFVHLAEVADKTGRNEKSVNAARVLLTGDLDFNGKRTAALMSRKFYLSAGMPNSAFRKSAGFADKGLRCKFDIID